MADYKHLIPFIKKAEGGLSITSTDTASANRSPCTYNGKTGWHTNKGIQWISFKENASKLGYNPSCDNFISMPDSIWIKIYKKAYWDAFDLDNSKSQIIANVIVSWAWGSGVGGSYRSLAKFVNEKYNKSYSTTYSYSNAKLIVKELNDIADKKGIAVLFNQLNDWRKQFYIKTGQTANIDGWLNRLNSFKEYNESVLKQITTFQLNFIKNYWWVVLLGTAGVVGVVYATVKMKK